MLRIVSGVIVGWCLLGGVASAQAANQDLVALGRKLFEDKRCTTCHMAEMKGNKQLPLDGVRTRLKEPDVRRWITSPDEMTAKLEKKPLLPMIKFPLTTPEVDALVAYVMSLKPAAP